MIPPLATGESSHNLAPVYFLISVIVGLQIQQMQQIQMQMQQQQFVQAAAAPAVSMSQPPQYYIPNQAGYPQPQQQPQQQQGWN